jgi:hypothetical protein
MSPVTCSRRRATTEPFGLLADAVYTFGFAR